LGSGGSEGPRSPASENVNSLYLLCAGSRLVLSFFINEIGTSCARSFFKKKITKFSICTS
jgi:hypothetical protein